MTKLSPLQLQMLLDVRCYGDPWHTPVSRWRAPAYDEAVDYMLDSQLIALNSNQIRLTEQGERRVELALGAIRDTVRESTHVIKIEVDGLALQDAVRKINDAFSDVETDDNANTVADVVLRKLLGHGVSVARQPDVVDRWRHVARASTYVRDPRMVLMQINSAALADGAQCVVDFDKRTARWAHSTDDGQYWKLQTVDAIDGATWCVPYTCEQDHSQWLRPVREFFDGRFVQVRS